MRKTQFENDNYYHIYGRGVDKRDIFLDSTDLERFFQSMEEFNTINPIGSIFQNSFRKKQLGPSGSKLGTPTVEFTAYCLNPNHYHLLVKQLQDGGISNFMNRLSAGYTKYFNYKYKRSGYLFQGEFKAVHIDSNEYLLHLNIYVNLNPLVHGLRPAGSKSSWEEYIGERGEDFCEKDIILEQFKGVDDYKKFAEESLQSIRERKELEKYLLE